MPRRPDTHIDSFFLDIGVFYVWLMGTETAECLEMRIGMRTP